MITNIYDVTFDVPVTRWKSEPKIERVEGRDRRQVLSQVMSQFPTGRNFQTSFVRSKSCAHMAIA